MQLGATGNSHIKYFKTNKQKKSMITPVQNTHYKQKCIILSQKYI